MAELELMKKRAEGEVLGTSLAGEVVTARRCDVHVVYDGDNWGAGNPPMWWECRGCPAMAGANFRATAARGILEHLLDHLDRGDVALLDGYAEYLVGWTFKEAGLFP